MTEEVKEVIELFEGLIDVIPTLDKEELDQLEDIFKQIENNKVKRQIRERYEREKHLLQYCFNTAEEANDYAKRVAEEFIPQFDVKCDTDDSQVICNEWYHTPVWITSISDVQRIRLVIGIDKNSPEEPFAYSLSCSHSKLYTYGMFDVRDHCETFEQAVKDACNQFKIEIYEASITIQKLKDIADSL